MCLGQALVPIHLQGLSTTQFPEKSQDLTTREVVLMTHFSLKKMTPRWVPVTHALILATQEAEIRRIMVQSQPRQIVHETLS
jgi:hypothetical protein